MLVWYWDITGGYVVRQLLSSFADKHDLLCKAILYCIKYRTKGIAICVSLEAWNIE